jgi:hypothetical protein
MIGLGKFCFISKAGEASSHGVKKAYYFLQYVFIRIIRILDDATNRTDNTVNSHVVYGRTPV